MSYPSACDVVGWLSRAGVERAGLVALALAPGVGVGLAVPARPGVGSDRDASMAASSPGVAVFAVPAEDPSSVVGLVEDAVRPRWVMWSSATAHTLVQDGVRVATSWDLAAVHRLIFGAWRADPAVVWAALAGLDPDTIPAAAPADLFHQVDPGDSDDPVGPDGHLRVGWTDGGWAQTPWRLSRWAGLAGAAAVAQQQRLGGRQAAVTARVESTIELLCAEMSLDGLPLDRGIAEEILAGLIGPRPHNDAETVEARRRRDQQVFAHLPAGVTVDLRSPGQVKSLLAALGVDVPDTRAGRLRAVRDRHPVVDAVLAWRKAERVATTYGYGWLDRHVSDGRLRGGWTAADGAAGRMTASNGLHNLPADLRPAVVADPGWVFVRADLGQIEPRVLAAVSGDPALIDATSRDDLYAPVAAALGVDRATAKVAVLGAMYGQTTGHGAQALRRLRAAYPTAMAYLDTAAAAGRTGKDLRTHGGRLIKTGPTAASDLDDQAARTQAAAQGRYARNALIQGAAAELFKLWAVTVRTRIRPSEARIVLCLHDELLVHTPRHHADDIAALLGDCLQQAAQQWAPQSAARFTADITTISRWSDTKAPQPDPA